MGIFSHAKQVIRRRQTKSKQVQVPRGHFAIYVGDNGKQEKKRFVVPISYLKQPLFQALLKEAAEEFGYDHGMHGLLLPCSEYYFLNLISLLNDSSRPDQR